MPTSDPDGKPELLQFIRNIYRDVDSILDIGPGSGTYARLLAPISNIDAVEIFEPYVEHFRLRSLYRHVYVADVREFSPTVFYRFIILGDVLEHIPVIDAVPLLDRLKVSCDYLLVSVPWTYPQGAAYGNEHERHHQADLTPAVMSERYPTLVPLYLGPIIGVYYSNA